MATYYIVEAYYQGRAKGRRFVRNKYDTLAKARAKVRSLKRTKSVTSIELYKVVEGRFGKTTTGILSLTPGRKPRIGEIKEDTRKNAPYFFDSKTLKMFGQTMSSFKVYMTKEGKVYIVAPSYSKDYRTGKRIRMSDTIREYVKGARNGQGDLKLTKLSTQQIIAKSK